MFSNNNHKVIGRLSKASLKNGKLRNRFVGGVIFLTAFLLALTATLGYNTAMEYKNYAKYQSMMTAINDEQFKKITSNPEVASYGLYQEVGTGKDGEVTIKVVYADEKAANFLNYNIVEGNMPTEADEVVIDRNFADGKSIGDKIKAEYRNYISRDIVTEEFTISGFMEFTGGYNLSSYMMVVSEAFIETDEHLSQYNPDIMLRIKNPSDYSNQGIRDKILEIGITSGVTKDHILYNSLNIDSNNTTTETRTAVVGIAAIILVACSLVIYNIFYVSIVGKVKEYGQLRTIGTTKRQVRKIVYREGRILSLIYIPVGILSGLLVSYFSGPHRWMMLPDIGIGVLCSMIVFLTIMIAVRKPAQMAASASPIEAASFTGVGGNKKKSKHTAKALNPASLGAANLSRNKKKAVITFTSLILSGILFITVTTFLGSIDPVYRAEQNYTNGGEYKIKFNGELYSPTVSLNNMQVNNPLSDVLMDKLLKIEGVDHIVKTKQITGWVSDIDHNENEFNLINIRKDQLEEFGKYLVSGNLEDVFTEKNAVILNLGGQDYSYYGVNYEIGDNVPVVLYDGEKEVEDSFNIIAAVNNPNWSDSFYFSDEKIDGVIEENPNVELEIMSSQGYSEDVESQIKAIISSEEKLEFDSKENYIAMMKEATKSMSLALYGFTIFIAFFAIVNLVNTIITNIISRRKEIGLLQAVGMTRKQIISMLNVENMACIFGSFAASMLAGNLIGAALSSSLSKIPGLSYIIYRFPLTAILLYLIVMILLQIIVTLYVRKEIPKQSIIERIREN